MKRINIVFILIVVFLSSFSICDSTAYANEEGLKEDLENQVEDHINSIISPELEDYFNRLKTNLGVDFTFKEFLKSIISGDTPLTIESIGGFFNNAFRKELKYTFLSLLNVIVLSIISSLSGHLSSGFKKDSTRQIVSWVIYGTIIATLAISIGSFVVTTKSIIDDLSTFLDLFTPIIVTLITALGGKAGLTILPPIALLISNFALKLIINMIIPIFFAITIFTFVGNLTDTVKLDTLSKSFKSIASWALGIVFSGLMIFVSVQGLVGASIDTIGVKFSKFAISSYVPILGGYLSDGFDIVMASCVLIKNALGLTGVLVLITIALIPLIKIVVYSLVLKLVAGIIEPIGEVKIASLLYTTSSNLNLLIAAVGGAFFLVLTVLLIVIGSFNSGVV
ncbi:MAG: stage III sporulation protein AE [Clostridia bacterium]|nr:stage III sporulation protein AE [Clostridia bacterium]